MQDTREQGLDVPVPRIIEQFVGVPKIVFQDRIWQRTFEQFAGSPALEEPVFKVFTEDRVEQRLVEQTTEVLQISSKDQILQRTRDQILDVPAPLMMEELGDVPKMVSQNRTHRRTAEQIAVVPVFHIFSQDRV